MPGTAIEIQAYRPPRSIGADRITDSSAGKVQRPLHQNCGFLLATLVVNGLLIQLLTCDLGWSLPAPAGRPLTFEVDTNTMRAVFIEAPVTTPMAIAPSTITAIQLAHPVARAQLRRTAKALATDGATRNTDAVSHTVRDSSSQSETERLQGIYRGQISARLQRSLEAARIPSDRHCRLIIEQNARGEMIAARTEHCSDDPGLLAAVRQASPLPAPPRAEIFQSELIVELDRELKVRW